MYTPQRILIFLMGSLGDTLVALPALHLIAKKYPDAERRILTHYPISAKAAPMDALLSGSGLVHGYFRLQGENRGLRAMLEMASEIRKWQADLLIHLHEPRGHNNAIRDSIFFLLCGIVRQIGVPLTPDLQQLRFDHETGRYEHRSAYLARKVSVIGDVEMAQRSAWNLLLNADEIRRAGQAVAGLGQPGRILAMSIGTKAEVNEWGDDYWQQMLADVSARRPDVGLVAIGASSESARTAQILRSWRGSAVNLCGQLTVRESAAVLQKAHLYVGHDSGPMHLAATMGTRCVGIFSARNLPGIWFPYGDGHRVFYRQVECSGCRKTECIEFAKKCIRGIAPTEVADAIVETIG